MDDQLATTCPTCGARPGDPCRTSSKKPARRPHAARGAHLEPEPEIRSTPAQARRLLKFRDADHPDTVVETYGRCNAAAEMVEDILATFPPDRWLTLSVQMLDRDLLLNDDWWSALQRRRQRRMGRHRDGTLPSYSTRVTAGHQMAVASAAMFLLEGPPESPVVAPDDGIEWAMRDAVVEAYRRAGGQCQAHGLHHRDCPGAITPSAEAFFSVHHVFTREDAKRLAKHPAKVPDPATGEILFECPGAQCTEAFATVDATAAHYYARHVDVPANLIVVYNGLTGRGAGGCHGRIHTERTSARTLGLLAPKGAII